MSLLQAVLVFFAGGVAGTMNAIVGSGSLITFPTLLAIGLPSVTANVTNNIGVWPGNVGGIVGYRRELVGQRARLVRLGLASLAGGAVGAVLLLTMPSSAFDAVVPVLIAIGIMLVIAGPRVSAWVARRAAQRGVHPEHGHWWVWPALAGTGVYGGYFGAAQGVLMLAILGIGVEDTLQRNNATKNVLGALVNGIAAIIFIFAAHIDWSVALVMAAGSTVGGLIGGSLGRRLKPDVLRAIIVIVGLVALVSFLVKN